MKGGSQGRKTVLKSNGGDNYDAIVEALTKYDNVVLDGSNGSFRISHQMEFNRLSHKTIEGVNGKGVKNIFQASDDAKAYQFKNCKFEEPFTPVDRGTVVLPY